MSSHASTRHSRPDRPFPWTTARRPVIGMLHLSPLPGAPRYGGNLETVRDRLLGDARALAAGGVHALLLENFGDAPFYPGRVPRHVAACMASLAAEVRRRVEVPLGINVLRNDGCTALGVAAAVGGAFVRVNVLCGARLTDQGIVEGIAHDLLRLRRQLGAEGVQILADISVKHSAPMARISLDEEVRDTIERGGADGIIVSGTATGSPALVEELSAALEAAGGVPVLVGSGVTPESVRDCRDLADGFIVGSALKVDGQATNPVDPDRVRALMERVE